MLYVSYKFLKGLEEDYNIVINWLEINPKNYSWFFYYIIGKQIIEMKINGKNHQRYCIFTFIIYSSFISPTEINSKKGFIMIRLLYI